MQAAGSPPPCCTREPALSRTVDPRFPARLRQLRQQRGLSLRALCALTHFGKSTLSELENGVKAPSPDTAARLDAALGAGGELAAMATPARGTEMEHRIAHVLTHPRQLDAAAVEALGEVLAARRRLDDVIDSAILLPAVAPEREAVAQLARDARGPHAAELRRLAATWTQFHGWLLAESRRDAAAARVLDRAAAEARELGDGTLVAQAADFLGFVARQRGEHRATARWCLTARDTSGATTLQRAINAGHAAGALAMVGERREARRLLDEAGRLAGEGGTPATAYWLTPEFVRLGLGLAWLALGDRAEAAGLLRSGLGSLPAGWAEAEWAAEYREALATAEA